MPLVGIPALEHQIRRVQKSKYVDVIVIATTINAADEPLAELAKKLGVEVYRGSEMDVLDRVLKSTQSVNGDIIVELTGDCPATDPALVDRSIEEFFNSGADYAANTIQDTYPNGFDVRVFPTSVLAKVAELTNDPVDRVHVSYYIYNHPELFKLHNWVATPEEHGPELRVTLDEESDYELIKAVFEALYPSNPNFTAGDVVQWLYKHPDIIALNKNVRQKEASEL
jgi:spore coat polysaccharide biosynthesis protein SpsF